MAQSDKHLGTPLTLVGD